MRYFDIKTGRYPGHYAIPEKYKLGELRLIKQIASVGVAELGEALEKGDPEALAAMVLIAMQRSGKPVTLDDVLDLELEDIEAKSDEDEPAESEGKDDAPETLNGNQATIPVNSGSLPTDTTLASVPLT